MADEDNMVPQQQIDDFVTRLQQGAGANLQSVILYGSAATADAGLGSLDRFGVLQGCGATAFF